MRLDNRGAEGSAVRKQVQMAEVYTEEAGELPPSGNAGGYASTRDARTEKDRRGSPRVKTLGRSTSSNPSQGKQGATSQATA